MGYSLCTSAISNVPVSSFTTRRQPRPHPCPKCQKSLTHASLALPFPVQDAEKRGFCSECLVLVNCKPSPKVYLRISRCSVSYRQCAHPAAGDLAPFIAVQVVVHQTLPPPVLDIIPCLRVVATGTAAVLPCSE